MKIIGDIHGQVEIYKSMIIGTEATLQIGDMGFSYDHLKDVDPDRNIFIPGNHENYNTVWDYPHAIGHFGMRNHGGLDFFFIRGELSVDKRYRKENIDWFRDEELGTSQVEECIRLYEEKKPSVVISHGCPMSISEKVARWSKKETEERFGCTLPSWTAKFLQVMYGIHQPDLWVFGHYHQNKLVKDGKTSFLCVDEYSYIRI